MDNKVKVLLLLPVIAMLSACGGSSISVNKASESLPNVTVSDFDHDNDGQLTYQEQYRLWISLTADQKASLAESNGFTVAQAVSYTHLTLPTNREV